MAILNIGREEIETRPRGITGEPRSSVTQCLHEHPDMHPVGSPSAWCFPRRISYPEDTRAGSFLSKFDFR
jgi:hypothetical protein